MTHEEICTYEVSKLAKEKGFPQHIGNDAYIEENKYDDEYEVECCYPIQFIPDYLPTITAPTQSLLQRWLREEKGIAICVDIYEGGWFFDISTFYQQDKGVCLVDIPYKSSSVTPDYSTYELALENALKYALENLV